MAQTSRLVLEIDSRDAEQKAADTRKALEALEAVGVRGTAAMDKLSDGMGSLGESSQSASNRLRAQKNELSVLLGQINPVTKQLGELDRQEKELLKNKKLGLLDAETFTEYQGRINSTRADLGRFSADMTKTGISAKQTAAALRGVPAQFTDIAVSLQAGQAPLTVFLQQGGQLKDMFGGAGPAAKALGGYVLGLINPFTVAAAAIGALGLAYYQGSKEQDAYRLSIVTTGNAAGTTTLALAEMARRVGGTVGTTAEAAAALAQLAGTGNIASTSFERIATSAIAYGKATGKAVSETIAEFSRLADDPVKAVAELNNKYNFLTASVYEQVRAAQEMGEKEAAASIAQEAYAKALTERAANVKASLGTLERAWNDLAGAAKNGWDAILGIGRESNDGPDVKAIQQKINYLKSTLDTAYEDGNARERIASLQAELDAYDKRSRAEQKAAADAARAAQVQRDGQADYEAFQKNFESNFTKRQKMNKALEDEEKRINGARLAGYTITAEQEKAALTAIRENSIYKEAPEKKSKTYTEDAGTKALDDARKRYAVLQQQNSLLGVQGADTRKLGADAQKLVEWEQQLADIKSKKTLTADQKSLLASADLYTAQLKRNAAQEKINDLKQAELQSTAKLLAFQENLNSQLNLAQAGLNEKLAGAGLGDKSLQRLQEQQQIQQSYQQQLDRLTYDYNKSDKSSSTTDLYNKETASLQSALQQRLAMQRDYYAQVDQQQSDWSLGASAAFQNYRDQAANVAGQTQTLFTNAFSGMEDVFVSFVKTGKVSFSSLTDSIISDMARMAARQASSSLLTSLFGMGASMFAGAGGANGFAAGSAAATSSSLGASAAGYSAKYGFSAGGYTGDGGKYEPKGVVHGGEFVVQKSVVSQPGVRDFLERMNRNSNGYADGGYVVPTGAVASSNAASSAPSKGAGMPSVQNVYHINGSADDRTVQQIKAAAEQATVNAIKYIAKDFSSNGELRRSLAKR